MCAREGMAMKGQEGIAPPGRSRAGQGHTSPTSLSSAISPNTPKALTALSSLSLPHRLLSSSLCHHTELVQAQQDLQKSCWKPPFAVNPQG